MTSPDAGRALRGLEGILAADLDRATVRAWLAEADGAALREPGAHLMQALICLGRLTRSGDVARASRGELDAWWKTIADAGGQADLLLGAIDADVEARVTRTGGRLAAFLAGDEDARAALAAHFDEEGGDPPALAASSGDAAPALLIGERDDLESCLVALGQAAMSGVSAAAKLEQRGIAALRAVDAIGGALEYELVATLPRGWKDAWLERIARVDDSSWWLQLVVTHELRRDPRVARALAPRPERAPRKPGILKLPRASIPAAVSMMMGANEAGGIDEVLERPLGEPVAQLFDAEVLVYTVTEGRGEAPSLAGLVVRERSGELSRIESVTLSPPGPVAPVRSRIDLAWWVPLAGTADRGRELIVRYRRAESFAADEEALRLELV